MSELGLVDMADGPVFDQIVRKEIKDAEPIVINTNTKTQEEIEAEQKANLLKSLLEDLKKIANPNADSSLKERLDNLAAIIADDDKKAEIGDLATNFESVQNEFTNKGGAGGASDEDKAALKKKLFGFINAQIAIIENKVGEASISPEAKKKLETAKMLHESASALMKIAKDSDASLPGKLNALADRTEINDEIKSAGALQKLTDDLDKIANVNADKSFKERLDDLKKILEGEHKDELGSLAKNVETLETNFSKDLAKDGADENKVKADYKTKLINTIAGQSKSIKASNKLKEDFAKLNADIEVAKKSLNEDDTKKKAAKETLSTKIKTHAENIESKAKALEAEAKKKPKQPKSTENSSGGKSSFKVKNWREWAVIKKFTKGKSGETTIEAETTEQPVESGAKTKSGMSARGKVITWVSVIVGAPAIFAAGYNLKSTPPDARLEVIKDGIIRVYEVQPGSVIKVPTETGIATSTGDLEDPIIIDQETGNKMTEEEAEAKAKTKHGAFNTPGKSNGFKDGVAKVKGNNFAFNKGLTPGQLLKGDAYTL